MAVPSTTWTRQYVYGQAITGRYEAPITPVATTIVATTSAAFSTNSRGSKFQFSPSSIGAHGGRVVFTATRDLSVGRFVGFQINQFGWPFPGPSAVIDTFANGGVSILFFDSSGNWSEFYIEGSDFDEYDLEDGGWAAFRSAGISGPLQVCLERTRTPDASSGTLDWANIDGHEFIIRVVSTSGNTPNFDVGSMFVFDSPEEIEGEVANPAGFDTLSEAIRDANDNYQQADVFKNSAGNFNGGIGELYEPRYTYQIGDGSTPTYFRDSGSTITEYPTPESGIATQPVLLLAAVDRGLEINTSSTCDIELDGTILASADVAGGESFVNVSGNTSGSVLFNNCQFYRKTYITLDHASSTSCLFDDVERLEIDANTVLTSATLRNTASTSDGLYIASAAADYSAIIIDFRSSNLGNDITIEPPGTGTWTLTGITVQSGHTLKIRNDSAVTAITVSIPAGVTFSTSTAGGTVTVTQPAETFTINSSEASSLIQVFTTTTQTVLASATSNTLAYVHSSETVDYVIQKAGFIPQRVTAFVLSGSQTVTVDLVVDPVYDASHGLVYTTDASWSRSLNQLTVPTYAPTVRGVWSLMIDSFIAETTLRNTQFNLSMNGPNSLFLIEDAEGVNDATIENMTDGGVRYINTSDTATAEWAGLQSTGIATGFTGEFQQVDGSGTTDARATGQFDELVKTFGDSGHGNFDFRGHLVLKYQPNGYREVRVDVLDVYGISAIEPVLYVIGMEPIAISAATGDPGITITIVDHTGAPLVVGGKSFDFEIQGGGADSGTSILREINYNLSLDATYQGRDPFNWPEMVGELGDDYDTIQGLVEGIAGDHGFYVSRSGSDHPDFTRFQSNDGTYYTPAVTANISISALSDDGGSTRLQIHNETAKTASAWASLTVYSAATKALRSTGLGSESTGGLYFVVTTAGTSGASEPTWDTTVGNTTSDGSVTWTTYAILYHDADPASTSFSDSYIDGEEFVSGDTFRIRFADLNGATSFKTYETTGVVAVSGFTVEASPVADAVYAINAIDGSSTPITDIYTADYANNEIDLDTNLDFTNPKSYAFISFEQTTSQGMFQIWDAVTAIDPANYRNDVDIISIAFDETAGFVKQEDSDTSRWYKSDGTRPFKDPTTGGAGISMNWKNPVFTISTGSVLTAPEKAELTAASQASTVNTKIGTPDVTVSDDIAAISSTLTGIGTRRSCG